MSSAPSSKPFILIIHGAYFHFTIWSPFRALLATHGLESTCPQLPTSGDKTPTKSASQSDDIATIQRELHDLVSVKQRRVIVLAHSYGGIVACGSITPNFIANDPRASGVAHLVFLSAFVPQPGRILEDVFKGDWSQSKVELQFNEDGTCCGTNTAESMFGDINEEDRARAAELAAATTTHNWAANGLAVQGSPYRDVPSMYIFCRRDLAIMPTLQEAMVKDAEDAGAKFERVDIDSGHCPFLSRPEQLLDIISSFEVAISQRDWDWAGT